MLRGGPGDVVTVYPAWPPRLTELPLVGFAAEIDANRLIQRKILCDVFAVALDEIEILAAVALDLLSRFFLLRGHGGIHEPIAALEKCFAADLAAVGCDFACVLFRVVVLDVAAKVS